MYDREEKWRAVAVDDFVASDLRPNDAEAPTPTRADDVVYGRVVRDGGRTWLQYWLFSAYNGQDRGIVRTGRHEGDWELFQVGLEGDGRPGVATLSQHSSYAACRWTSSSAKRAAPGSTSQTRRTRSTRGAAFHDRPFPDPNDETRGRSAGVRAEVRRISDAGPAWIRLDGRWGGSSGGWVPGEQASPYGPAFSGDRWARPAEVHAAARGCFTAPAGARWLVPALIAASLAAGMVALLAWRRHRTRGPSVTLGA